MSARSPVFPLTPKSKKKYLEELSKIAELKERFDGGHNNYKMLKILSEADISYNFSDGTIKINNIAEIIKIEYEYNDQKFSITNNDINEFYNFIKVYFPKENIAEQLYVMKKADKEFPDLNNGKESRYNSVSSRRTARDIGTLHNDHNFRDFCKSLIITQYVQEVLQNLGLENSSFTQLEAKFSLNGQEKDRTPQSFLRDSFVVIGENIFQSENVGFVGLAALSDAKYSNKYQGEVKKIPFIAPGGNLVIDEKNKRILIAASVEEYSLKKIDPFSGEEPEIMDRAIIFENGIKKEVGIDEFTKTAKDWASSIGYEAVIVARKQYDGNKIYDFYHLDLFCNVTSNGILILPEEDIISKESRDELIKIYGENIITISKEEREAFVSNFIEFENGHILLTKPGAASESFAKKLNERGFKVIIPKISLQMSEDSGIRCFSQLVPGVTKQEIPENKVDCAVVEKEELVAVDDERSPGWADKVEITIADTEIKKSFVAREFYKKTVAYCKKDGDHFYKIEEKNKSIFCDESEMQYSEISGNEEVVAICKKDEEELSEIDTKLQNARAQINEIMKFLSVNENKKPLDSEIYEEKYNVIKVADKLYLIDERAENYPLSEMNFDGKKVELQACEYENHKDIVLQIMTELRGRTAIPSVDPSANSSVNIGGGNYLDPSDH